MVPAPADEIVKALNRMHAETVGRASDDDDLTIKIAAYIERLGEYPADVALTVCRRWPDRSRWWPSWSELRAECERLVAYRRRLQRTLSELVEADHDSRPQP